MDIEQTVSDMRMTITAHTEQIKTLFLRQECLDDMARAVAILATKMESLEKGQSNIEKSLEELKSVPKKNWQTLTAAIISGIVGAVLGAVVALFS